MRPNNRSKRANYPRLAELKQGFLLQLELFVLETDCAASWAELGLLSSLFPLRPLHFLFFSHFFCSTKWPWLTITNHPPRCPPPLPLPASEITQGPLSLSCSLASFLLGSLQPEVTFPSLQAHRLKARLLFSFNKLLSFLSFSVSVFEI